MNMYTVYINFHCVGFSKIYSDKEKDNRLSEDVLMTELFNRMGFLHSNHEYLDYLPGHNSKEKIYVEADNDYTCYFGEVSQAIIHQFRIDFNTIDILSIMDWETESCRDTLRRLIDELLNEDGMWLFLMQPTIKEVLDAWWDFDNVEKPTYDELYFCSDWKG